jgi:hypothetical protein
MNSKLLPCLALVLSGGMVGCSTVHRHPSNISPVAQRIVQRMSDYYEHLSGFEGSNSITDQSPTFKTTRTKQFAFLRPNKFSIRSESTNDWQWICDGTNFYDYRPYYFNSYTKAPAPAHFEDAITNWIGGELVHLMVSTNRFHYIMSGFGGDMVALKDEGNESVDGVTCHHLLMRERGSRTAEFWIAAGASPFIVKYALRFPAKPPAKGVWIHTETISGWRSNFPIPAEQFAFVPSGDAIEHPSNSDTVQLSVTLTNGVEKREMRFTSNDEPDNMEIFLKKNGKHFQAVALKAILDKYTDLTANDLAFLNIEPSLPEAAEKTFTATYALPKTLETTNSSQFRETKEQTIVVTLKPGGNVICISRGISISSHSAPETRPRQVHSRSP